MPRISFKSEDSEGGWEPLPDGTYHFIVDAIEEKVSSKGNAQLKVNLHVSEGPQEGKKVVMWWAMTPKSGWKMEEILNAAGIDWDKVETGETNSDTGKPLFELSFDTDDLPGCEIVADASVEKYQGKDQQRFSNERAPDGADGSNGAAEEESAPAEEAAAEAAEGADAPAAGTSVGGSRRRRVRT
jgi:hypothetical protein